jgi:AcrR family transcriptional regulator
MPKATREQSEATARNVLETARAQFAEKGYAAVGLDDVAAAAGVTRGAVYHHYRSKLGLFAAVHEAVQASVAAAIENATAGIEDPWRSLETGCRAFLDAAVADDTRRIMFVDGPSVLGWEQWRQADSRHSERHLDEVLVALAVPAPAATSALLSGAMNAAAGWAAAAPDRGAAVAEAWSALRPMLAALRCG